MLLGPIVLGPILDPDPIEVDPDPIELLLYTVLNTLRSFRAQSPRPIDD